MARKALPWSNTLYNRSLQVGTDDNNFYTELNRRVNRAKTIEERQKAIEAVEFYLAFHTDACTNNNKSAWGRARRQARRLDIYNNARELIGICDVAFRGEGDED
jgi:gamma-glutamyl phosphate reductase